LDAKKDANMDPYERLRAMLDTHPAGCPEAPEVIEILKLLFSEEEARVGYND